MTRSEQIEKAAAELRRVLGEEPLRRYTAECLSRLGAAIALPPDPPGECCRRTAEAMREAAADVVIRAPDGTPGGDYAHRMSLRLADRIRALPLPGAKEDR